MFLMPPFVLRQRTYLRYSRPASNMQEYYHTPYLCAETEDEHVGRGMPAQPVWVVHQ
jgi:hypothetical protein